jgi:hypothetical protein
MRLVDDQGRLFGRWNVIDGLIAIVLVGLVPLLYGAYVLFRPQTPSLVSIEPTRAFTGDVDLTIRGINLRPFMRVSVGNKQGLTYLFEDPTKAVVPVSALAPGVYDVILYDNAQERARLPRALEIVDIPRPDAQVQLIGSFSGLSDAAVQQLKPGLRLTGLGEVSRLGKPVASVTRTLLGAGLVQDLRSQGLFNVPAVVRATCALVPRNGIVNCLSGGTSVMEDAVLTVALPVGSAMFQIDQIMSDVATETITARVRFAGDRAVIDRLKEGDRDARRQNEIAGEGTIVSLGGVRTSGTSVGVVVPASALVQPFAATELAFRDGTLRLPAQRLQGRWQYASRSLLIGSVLTFSGPGYQVHATIVALEPPAGAKP